MKGAVRTGGGLVLALLLAAGCYYSVEDPADGAGGGGAGGSGGSAGSGGQTGGAAGTPNVCDPECKTNELCVAGKCQLDCAGLTECAGQCKDTTVDPEHCGGCGKACGSGQLCDGATCKSSCSAGKTACGSSCVDLQTDVSHCGGCGSPCGANDDCVGGKCVPSCESSLTQALTDPWGATWDGVERAAATADAAQQACDAIRARLPTATELFRVRKGQPGAVGSANTDLWSAAPVDLSTQLAVRLSDGKTTALPRQESHAYRCVCPGPEPAGFSAGHCHGLPASECFAHSLGGTVYDFDVRDRPAMPKTSAIFECGFVGGRLPTIAELVGAIGIGLPNGSDVAAFIADEASDTKSATVRWSGVATNWNPQNGLLFAHARATLLPVRCVGAATHPGAHPSAIPAEFVSKSGRKLDGADAAPATYSAAIDNCFSRGGHLPSATELVEMIVEGAPSGSGLLLMTADHVSAAEALAVRWSGVQPRFSFGADAQAVATTSAQPYRCIFYPVDATFTAPPAGQCSGGCKKFDLTPPAAMWVDQESRAAVTGGAAARDCGALGARLTSVRDLLEVIPRGLPDASPGLLATLESVSDASGDMILLPNSANVLTAPDAAASYSVQLKGATSGYRCLWTNEVR